jgi:hypothetical protein
MALVTVLDRGVPGERRAAGLLRPGPNGGRAGDRVAKAQPLTSGLLRAAARLKVRKVLRTQKEDMASSCLMAAARCRRLGEQPYVQWGAADPMHQTYGSILPVCEDQPSSLDSDLSANLRRVMGVAGGAADALSRRSGSQSSMLPLSWTFPPRLGGTFGSRPSFVAQVEVPAIWGSLQPDRQSGEVRHVSPRGTSAQQCVRQPRCRPSQAAPR